MQCPKCKKFNTQVIDSRTYCQLVKRRRVCLKCSFRFTTHEKPEIPKLIVIKKDGHKEPYQREKIQNGITKACKKRPVTKERITKAVDKIENEIFDKNYQEIESKIIGEKVMKTLKKIDKVAYLRFVSVYHSFDNLQAFETEINKLN